ncbi:MAG: hypothetical protein WBW87_07790 [Candidatus Cybelea sp.]
MEHSDRGQEFDEDEYVTKVIGAEAAVKLSNALASIDANGYVILAGLSHDQRSYLKLPKAVKVIEIGAVPGCERHGMVGNRAGTVRS